jgi:hypothetical protein
MDSGQRRVLVIADLGHASPRIPGLFSELTNLGWEVDIVSPKLTKSQAKRFLSGFDLPSSLRIHFTGLYYSNYKLVLGNGLWEKAKRALAHKLVAVLRFFWLISCFDFFNARMSKGVEAHKFWVPAALKCVWRISDGTPSSKYSVVFSSSSPFTAHLVAHEISAKFNVPWVADYRDLWTLNHVNTTAVDFNQTKGRLEKRALQQAGLVVTVSEDLKCQQTLLYDGPIKVIHNGYKQESRELNLVQNKPKKIVYTGSVYEDFMDLELLLNTVDEFQEGKEFHNFELTFIGTSCENVKNHYRKKGSQIPAYLRLGGELSRVESFKLQKESDIGLVFGWKNKDFTGSFPTKFFEYLGANLHILFVGGFETEECAKEIVSGGLGTLAHTRNQLSKFLELYQDAQLHLPKPDRAKKFRYSELARTLDVELRKFSGDTLN